MNKAELAEKPQGDYYDVTAINWFCGGIGHRWSSGTHRRLFDGYDLQLEEKKINWQKEPSTETL